MSNNQKNAVAVTYTLNLAPKSVVTGPKFLQFNKVTFTSHSSKSKDLEKLQQFKVPPPPIKLGKLQFPLTS
jgi:hypothetical protein